VANLHHLVVANLLHKNLAVALSHLTHCAVAATLSHCAAALAYDLQSLEFFSVVKNFHFLEIHNFLHKFIILRALFILFA
jgi:hypothetical protein